MNSEEIVNVLTDVLVRLETSVNMLVDGKSIQSYQKLSSAKDKLFSLRTKIISDDKELHKKLQEQLSKRGSA